MMKKCFYKSAKLTFMCGILGVLPSVDVVQFKGALDSIAHRGPDGYGIWEDRNEVLRLINEYWISPKEEERPISINLVENAFYC
jgi:asparagine synthetase B (glutamine-hydrolysing)